jgi:F420-non-reducing hydrogenase iron-sulfur subunit
MTAATKKTRAKRSAAAPKSKRGAEAPATWDPNIVVFACNWCSYAGADTAGVSRIQHQPHFRMIRVMCSGRIQPGFVLRAFEKGADGVLVSGCHFGDCHYVFGNERAVEQFEKTKNMVKLLGLEEGRLRLEWISAAEGARFAQVINEFTDQVRALGPSPVAISSQRSAVSGQPEVPTASRG